LNIAIISFQDNTDIIGAKYVHSFLIAHHYNSHLILQPHSETKSDSAIFQFIEDHNIQLVGISLMSSEFFRASHFAKELKCRFNSIPLVFGGIHATIAPDDCLSVGDFTVRGEGEHTFLTFIRCLEESKDYHDIPGICFKKDGTLSSNPSPILEQNIDIFPFPQHLPQQMYVVHKNNLTLMNRKLFNYYSRYNGTFPNIITTRGCPYSCTYCCNSAYKDLYGSRYNQLRKRSVESVISECLEIIRQNKDCLSLNIQDDCFLAYSKEWIDDFSEEYRNKIKLPLIMRTTPRHINKEKLIALKKAGLAIAMIGLQSGSDKVNKEIYKRNVVSSDFLAATNIVKDVGLYGYYDIILDNPYETEEDILKTLEIILQIRKPYQFQLFSLCLYQGTELHEKAKKDGLLFMDPRIDDYSVLSSNSLNKLIRMVPTVSACIVRYFIRHRDNGLLTVVINLFDFINKVILTPISFLKMMHYSYGSNFNMTAKLIKTFSKTAIGKMFK
jgi:anaerobic magnesium-protoporphyrin IX monomethyl ester cyclase